MVWQLIMINYLSLKKNSGPYQNRYDLPGGSQEVGESMVDTLEREILEETGFTVLSSTNNRLYSAWIYENDRRVVTHHVFNLFDVKLNSVAKKNYHNLLLTEKK